MLQEAATVHTGSEAEQMQLPVSGHLQSICIVGGISVINALEYTGEYG